MTKNKKDLLLAAIILAIAATGFLVNKQMYQKPAAYLEISVDGTILQTLDLHEDNEVTIDGVFGGTNHLIIKEGAAWIDSASCPDKVCVHQGKVHLNGQMIVCLPNRMVAEVVTQED